MFIQNAYTTTSRLYICLMEVAKLPVLVPAKPIDLLKCTIGISTFGGKWLCGSRIIILPLPFITSVVLTQAVDGQYTATFF